MGMYGDIMSTATSSMGGFWEMGFSLIGRAVAQGDYNKADALYNEIIRDLDAEEIPQFQEILFDNIPQMREIAVGSSGRTAQQGAIDKLSSFIDQDGLDAQARAQLQESMSAEDQRSRGNREAILQGRARRGIGGSGDELSALLADQQGSANRGRDASLDIAAQARSRALDALGKQGSLAGQMRGQDISAEKANQDAAQAREMFNAKMRMATQQGNNDGKLENAYARLAKRKMLNEAKGKKASRYLESARDTQAGFAGVGRAKNMSNQANAEGLQEMPF